MLKVAVAYRVRDRTNPSSTLRSTLHDGSPLSPMGLADRGLRAIAPMEPQTGGLATLLKYIVDMASYM